MGNPGKRKRIVTAVCVSAAVIILVLLYKQISPEDGALGRFFPKCPVKMLTGLDCPSCGIQRAVHALLNGDFAGALRLNFFIPFSVGYLFCLLLTRSFCNENSALRRFFWGIKGGAVYIGVYVGWFVIRNIFGI